jgi:GGDEF domain-containing protein
MVLDIDRFARINDSLGPERGDQVLQVIGHRLRESMGDRTPAEPAGGACPPQGGAPGRRRVRRAGQRRGAGGGGARSGLRLLQVVRAPIRVPGQEITLAARVGVAMMPEHATEADALLKAAETALNRAKRSPASRWRCSPKR